jgi:hypothetical protein
MSISSIWSNNSLSPASNSAHSQRHTDFQQLVSALQPGDLSAAQKAFAQFQSDLGTSNASGASANATASPGSSPFKNLISQIGNALQSGNISAAQQALTDFRNQAPSGTSGTSGASDGSGALLDAIFQALSQAGGVWTFSNQLFDGDKPLNDYCLVDSESVTSAWGIRARPVFSLAGPDWSGIVSPKWKQQRRR